MMVKRSMELYNVPILLETENSAKITETSTFVSAENLSLVQKTFVKKKFFSAQNQARLVCNRRCYWPT